MLRATCVPVDCAHAVSAGSRVSTAVGDDLLPPYFLGMSVTISCPFTLVIVALFPRLLPVTAWVRMFSGSDPTLYSDVRSYWAPLITVCKIRKDI